MNHKDLLMAIHNETIKSLKSLGIRHIRTLHESELSNYVDTAGNNRLPKEYPVEIELTLNLEADGYGNIGYGEKAAEAVSRVIETYRAENAANAPDVAALRRVEYYPNPNTEKSFGSCSVSGIVHFFISFYDNCNHYLSNQSQENIYVSALLSTDAPVNTTQGFDTVLQALREGKRIRRRAWHATEQYILLVPSSPLLTVDAGRPLARAGVPVGTQFSYSAHVDMFMTVNGMSSFGPWIPQQKDILADDWYIVE